MKKDIEYYNKESGDYSQKRYGGKIDNFIKYFFDRRLKIFLTFLKKEMKEGSNLLDIGCADGFVAFKAFGTSKGNIKRIVGIDTSPQMISQAKNNYKDYPFEFFIRGNEGSEKFDFIVELGVPISNWREEFAYVDSKLKEDGTYIFGTPGSKDSLYSRIKEDKHVEDPLSFAEFDALTSEFFEIKETKNYAFFTPFLWRVPLLGELFQPVFENIFSFILPDLFHERTYLLKKKNEYINKNKTLIDKGRGYANFWLQKERMMLLIRYLFSGGLSFATNIIFLYIFAEFFHIWYLLASTLAFIVAFVVSFLAQKIITFQDKTKDRIPHQAALYLTLAIFNLFANAAMMYILVDIVHIHYMVSQVISAGLIAVWNLAIYRYIIFPKRHDL